MTPTVAIFALSAVTVVGLLVGLIEMVWLENVFKHKSFPQKVISKFLIYTCFILLVNFITFPIAASLESNIPIWHRQVWLRFGNYLLSITFFSTLVQISFSLLLSLLYAAISENLGHTVLSNFFTGKYHAPRQEHRIFMFLDMKSSTTIAERLGDVRYFELLREYYASFSESIIKNYGEVYQYIGDEIVISWDAEKGLNNGYCIRCFFDMQKDLKNRASFFKKRFDIVPAFKAGLHIGKVTTGEIGALKKEIFYTGDVLNSTARIQGLCKSYEVDLIISSELIDQLPAHEFHIMPLDTVSLKGRLANMQINTIQ